MNQQDGAGAGRDATLYFGEIDPPAEIVEQRVGLEVDIIESCEEVEERVAGLGYQNLVAWIAEQTEEEGISLTGTGRQDEVFRRKFSPMLLIVGRDGLTGGQDAAWRGIVEAGCFDGLQIELEATRGGVRQGEVEQRSVSVANSCAERRFGKIPGGAGGKGYLPSLGQAMESHSVGAPSGAACMVCSA